MRVRQVGLVAIGLASLATVGWPSIALLPAFAPASPSGRAQPPVVGGTEVFLGTWGLLGSSLAWAGAIAALSVLAGWIVGGALAERWRAGRGAILTFLVSLPVALPAYLVFWSLWQAARPGSTVGDLAARADLIPLLREACLSLGLAAWATPLAAWTIASWRVARPDRTSDLLQVDGARWPRRWRMRAGLDRPALLRAWAVATLALLGESVSFDLAQVQTYGYELRTMDATGSPASAVMAAGWPAMAAAVVLLAIAGRSGRDGRRGVTVRPGRPRRSLVAWAVVLLACAPIASLLFDARHTSDAGGFFALYGRAAANSLGLAALAGAALAGLAAALANAWQSPERWERWAARAAAFPWLVAATVPATIVALALESAWNRPRVGPVVYDGPLILLLALVARLGVVAVLAASLAARARPRTQGDLLAIDAPVSIGARWLVARRTLLSAALVAGSVGAALAFSEIATTCRLVPPGIQLLATSTLNAIHYQQPETVVMASLVAIGLAAAAAVVVVLVVVRRSRPALALAAAATMVVTGCADDGHDFPSLPVERSIGSSGFGPGQFHTPRAIAFDPRDDRFFVVDKEARIQRFAPDGTMEREWRMPDFANGKPVGLSVHPDGRLFVADTHYYRVLVYDREGHELARFGSYGKEPGQFIYTTDVAFGPDGRIYVGEYGGNDRIQVFSPEFALLGSIGSFGVEPGQFSRPQSLVFDRTELLVADSNNHRIQVFDGDGHLLRVVGHAGRGPGELSYPRGILPLGDGTALVCEFGNHRVQRLDLRPGPGLGASLGIWGGPPSHRAGGSGESAATNGTENPIPPEDEVGRLQYPWDLAGRLGHVAILNSGVDRLVFTRLPG